MGDACDDSSDPPPAEEPDAGGSDLDGGSELDGGSGDDAGPTDDASASTRTDAGTDDDGRGEGQAEAGSGLRPDGAGVGTTTDSRNLAAGRDAGCSAVPAGRSGTGSAAAALLFAALLGLFSLRAVARREP